MNSPVSNQKLPLNTNTNDDIKYSQIPARKRLKFENTQWKE